MPSSLRLHDGEVHLWRARLDVDAGELSRLSRLLPRGDVERAERFAAVLARSRYTAARGMLRLLLARYLETDAADLVIVDDARGKPRLEDPGSQWLRFNLSHSQDLAVFAIVRDRAVGVDVEYLDQRISTDEIARRHFSPAEQRALAELQGDEGRRAFFSLWTLKEAYVKATGAGLQDALPELPLGDDDGVARSVMDVDPSGRQRHWVLQPFHAAASFAAAAAVEGVAAAIPRTAEWLTIA